MEKGEEKRVCIGAPVNSAPNLSELESSIHRKKGKEVGGKKPKRFSISFLTNDILFFSPFYSSPGVCPLPHTHFPLLMTRVGTFLQTNPSS